MDTFKDKQQFDDMEARGETPWRVWREPHRMLRGAVRHALEPPVRQVLCLGAHCDDLEIGCGGTVLTLASIANPPAFTWVVFGSNPTREAEAHRAAETLLRGTPNARIIIKKFRDGFLPYEGALVKEAFEELKGMVSPDLVLTHYRPTCTRTTA